MNKHQIEALVVNDQSNKTHSLQQIRIKKSNKIRYKQLKHYLNHQFSLLNRREILKSK